MRSNVFIYPNYLYITILSLAFSLFDNDVDDFDVCLHIYIKFLILDLPEDINT